MIGKKCVDYKVEGVRPRSRPKKTCNEVVEKRQSDRKTKQVGCYGPQ